MSGLCCGWVSVDGELNWEMVYWVVVVVVVGWKLGMGVCDEQEGARGSEGSFLTVSFVVVQARAGGTWVGYGVEPYC